ncbi:arylsulfatase [Maribacter polysaccharolyticus]|uniref:arylsulfatase n=1 Tax=Maribacter polysaccharolyticus TaxID=3020831 RepID=UPI00237F5A86|nr:arylsulfatase [Maribacter polysaccharolyticus]MDE3742690.1 arylsulfatase [Maribacter polysaccharolyticus]
MESFGKLNRGLALSLKLGMMVMFLCLGNIVKLQAQEKPNVILIMTDDQGYGDLSCHGNPIIETPNLDRLQSESIRLTDFHVSPFCTPTRAALMTGHYPGRTGAYRTSSGRTLMHTDEQTIANVFASNGYVTGMVGKWHLGDNAPHRPQDRGFQDVVWHKCGGVGQASDYWGNDYFDDVYERNGKYEKFEGYCTDVWFSESIRFIEKNKEKPFMLYLATNAPHGPYRVADKWSDPYKETVTWKNGANFYGMIANFDYNLGILRKRLVELGIAENTILVFMTDNGTSAGASFKGLDSEPLQGYNAGMRGKKSSIYDGGHRVPFFIYWPKGKLTGGKDINSLAAHIDVLPTLAELCEVTVPDTHQPDGISFAPLLTGKQTDKVRDSYIVQYHAGAYAKDSIEPWLNSAVLTSDWRLMNGKVLYNIKNDPEQKNDVSKKYPKVVENLRTYYMPYWESVSPRLKPVRIDIGSSLENPTVLCSQDWYMESGNPPWNFNAIQKYPRVTGPWMINIEKSGRYRFTLRQLPKEAHAIVKAKRAKIKIAGKTLEKRIEPDSKGVIFEIELQKGQAELLTYFFYEDGTSGGAYFTEVNAL